MIMYMLITTGRHPLYANGDSPDDYVKKLNDLKWEFPAEFNKYEHFD